MATFIYTRVSSVQQLDGMSLDAQMETCAAYLRLLKQKGEWTEGRWEVVREQCSGSLPFRQREKGRVLFEQLRRGDTLVCAKLDRAWRSASDALATIDELKKRGVAVHLVDLNGNVTDGISKLVFTIMSAVAAWERSRIGERVREAKREAARQGFYVGGKVPWHQRQVKMRGGKVKLVDDEKRAAIVKELRVWRQAGVPLRECQLRVAALGEKISTDAIRRVTFGSVAPAAMKRGRRQFGARKERA